MKSKYYKKETVIYKFKHEILLDKQYANATDAQRELLWEVFLSSLKQLRKISRHQANTWVYPKKELSNL